VAMNQWLNRSQPMTLQAGVILGYISAFFGLFQAGFFFPVFLGMGAGAFVTANNKRWGYYLLAICASLVGVILLLSLVSALLGFSASDLGSSVVRILFQLNNMVFPIALAVAVLHRQSREYQKIWFD